MIKYIYTIVFLFVFATVSNAQYTINIEATNTNGEVQNNLKIGVHPDASDYIDEGSPFNEYEFPGHGMGGTLHCFFKVPDKFTEGNTTCTYIDYRKENIEAAYKVVYIMDAQFGDEEMTLKWNIKENPRLDSAYIEDDYSTIDLFYYDMLAQDECTLTNDAWKKIKITLVFTDPVSVEDNQEETDISVYPNPASEYLKINVDNIQSYIIFDATGREVLNKDYNGQMVDISNLQKGFYNIVLIDYNANLQSKKFIKL